MRLAFTIRRYHPEVDAAPHDETYRLEVTRGMTILDALIRIKNEQDGRLTFRYSCRSAICGSCAMTINGSEKLACRTSVRKEWERYGAITVEPLRHLPVLKDLAVDMHSFWGKVQGIEPWVQAEHLPPTGPLSLPAGSAQFHNVDACIMCGACVAACTVHEVDQGFLGPDALAKDCRFVADPREDSAARTARLEVIQGPTGVWDCTRRSKSCGMSGRCWSGPVDERERRRRQGAVLDSAYPDQKPRGLPEVRPQAVHDRLSGRGLSLGRGAVEDQRGLAGVPGERGVPRRLPRVQEDRDELPGSRHGCPLQLGVRGAGR